MRWSLIPFVLLCGAAEARDCDPPKVSGKTITGLSEFAECAIDQIADLKRQNADLQERIEALEKSLALVPGQLTSVNGRVTRDGGDRLGRADFSVDARARQAPSELDIEQDALVELCRDGCSFTLVQSAIGLRETDATRVQAVGPCLLHYNADSGAWNRGGACGETLSGVDGNGVDLDVTGGEIIATAGEACIFADSGPRRSVDPETQALARDRTRGLVLFADPTLWTGTEQRFRCDLHLVQ